MRLQALPVRSETRTHCGASGGLVTVTRCIAPLLSPTRNPGEGLANVCLWH